MQHIRRDTVTYFNRKENRYLKKGYTKVLKSTLFLRKNYKFFMGVIIEITMIFQTTH